MKKLYPKKFTEDRYHGWQDILSSSIVTAGQLSKLLPVDAGNIRKIMNAYPMRINPYYLSLIKIDNGPLWKQAVPDIRELEDDFPDDPLTEENQSPVPGIIHRYPDRAVFLVSNQCALYCRFCMRKRKVGIPLNNSQDRIADGIKYLQSEKEIREVILSGGDPFLMEDDALRNILEALHSISHVEIIRIHTRTPCVLPQRITEDLAKLLKRFQPIFINTHFNHPDEITAEAAKACARLADSGIPLGCQTVLMKGVNDNPLVMKCLMQKLIKIRVKPYYLHHADPVKGTGHFRTSIESGVKIMAALRGYISGLCLPHYMIDLPGGGGKVPLLPEYRHGMHGNNLITQNYQGRVFHYPAG